MNSINLLNGEWNLENDKIDQQLHEEDASNLTVTKSSLCYKHGDEATPNQHCQISYISHNLKAKNW